MPHFTALYRDICTFFSQAPNNHGQIHHPELNDQLHHDTEQLRLFGL
jgi:hypothetical protein